MNFLIKPKKNGNILATIVIGKKFYNNWFKFSYPSWRLYCKKNQLGLVCFKTDIISKKDPMWKKATWQKMLIGKYLNDNFPKKIRNVCYLDSDIIINPFAPNIFDFHQTKKIRFQLINHAPIKCHHARDTALSQSCDASCRRIQR